MPTIMGTSFDLEFPNDHFEEDDEEERGRIKYFNQVLQLSAHLSLALRLLYSARSDAYKRWGFASEKDVVTHISDGLDRWFAALPDYREFPSIPSTEAWPFIKKSL